MQIEGDLPFSINFKVPFGIPFLQFIFSNETEGLETV